MRKTTCVVTAAIIGLTAVAYGQPAKETKGWDINEVVIAKIVPGKTDKTSLRQLLGDPMTSSQSEGMEFWLYRCNDANKKTHFYLSITFDDKGIVQDKKTTQSIP